MNRKEFLEKKFCMNNYSSEYVCKNLQKDLLDYQEFNKEQIRKLKFKQEELLELMNEAVMESIPEFEIKLYGSHATNLCLPWSDLDLVLVPKSNYVYNSSAQPLQLLYYCLLVKYEFI